MSDRLLTVDQGEAFILDSPILSGDISQATSRIIELRRTASPHLLVTANIDHVIDLHDGTELVAAYKEASLRVVDGTPLLWLLRLLGAKDVQRVTGADLIFKVAEDSRKNNWKVLITGGKESIADRAARNLSESFPGSQIVAIPMPYLDTAQDEKGYSVVQALLNHEPDVVFLCLGAPKQEEWFLRWKDQLPPAVYVGAGAAVDFAAGEKRRAPKFVQTIGLEWLWRMFQEFRRLAPRYLIKGPRFFGIAASSIFFRYLKRS